MVSLSSNCCRVDAVKASVNQLKLQVAQRNADAAGDTAVRAANQQLQSVDQQIKSGDANKAELALSAAKSSVEHLQYQRPKTHQGGPQLKPPQYGSLDIRA